MTEKQKRPSVKFISPKGVAIYPKLHKPDTKFKEAGQYTVKLRIEGLDGSIVAGSSVSGESLIAKITELRDTFLAETIEAINNKTIGPKWNTKERAEKLKTLKTPDVVTNEVDAEGNETGNIILHAKMTASGVSKKDGKPWTREPKVFDAKKKKMSPVPAIFGGSELKIAVEASPYFAPGTKEAPPVVGITYYLDAVQVLKLVKAGDRTADSYGFGEEEGFEDDTNEGGEQFDDSDATPAPTEGGAGPKSAAEF